MGSIFANLSKVGQAFMLPVAVLPVAGLLLGIGATDISFIPKAILDIMSAAGGSIFTILPLLFAIAVVIAFTKMDGAAALATVVGYYVFLSTMGVTANLIGMKTTVVLGVNTIDAGVLGGIIIGFIGAFAHNRYHRVQLPDYLGFFSGRRLVPIVTALFCLFFGLLFPFVWKPVGGAIALFSNWAAYQSPIIAFTAYGFLERLLIPMGLHHILNVPFFFEIGSFTKADGGVVHGEVTRYLAGDPTAGHFAGGYLFKMYGLPAAAMAIVYTAKPENRKKVASLMIPAAITSFLTGITEPIEFSFLFVAPALYFVHALLAGFAYFITNLLGIRHAMTFSHGMFDFLLLYSRSSHALWLIPLGCIYSVVYFSVFTFMIRVFNFQTPGRSLEVLEVEAQSDTDSDNKNYALSNKIIVAYGGKSNISVLESCISRLRVTVKDKNLVNQTELKSLGAKGVVVVGNGVQSIFGTQSDILRQVMQEILNSTADTPTLSKVVLTKPVLPLHEVLSIMVGALGGKKNIVKYTNCSTRCTIEFSDKSLVDVDKLINVGAKGVIVSGHSVQIILSPEIADVIEHLDRM